MAATATTDFATSPDTAPLRGPSPHHRRFSPEQLLGSDNDFYDLEIGLCDTAVLVNYSIANRFHNFIIGAVHTGFRLNFTNQIDIYSPTIEAFHVGIDASYGDTTHVYNAYLSGAEWPVGKPHGIGVRIAANMSESAVISPRMDMESATATPIINDSPTTIVLYWDSPGDPPSQCQIPPQCYGKNATAPP